MIGYFIYNGVIIAVDLFSSKKTAIKPNEVRTLDTSKPIMPQIYEALSGNKWSDRFNEIMEAMTCTSE